MRGQRTARTLATAAGALLALLLVAAGCSSDDGEEGSDDSTPPTSSPEEQAAGELPDLPAAEGAPVLVDLVQQRREDEGLPPYEVADDLAATVQPFVDQWAGGQLTEDDAVDQAQTAAADVGLVISDVAAIRSSGTADAEQLGRLGAAPGYDTLAVVGADSDAAGAVYLRVAGGPELTAEHLEEHERRAEEQFVQSREALDLPVPDETDGPLREAALDLACAEVAGDFPADLATTYGDEVWLAALRAPSPWFAGEDEMAESDEYSTSGAQTEDDEIEAYAVATCDQPADDGSVVTGIALDFGVPDDGAQAAWIDDAIARTAERDSAAREDLGLAALTRDPTLDQLAEGYATQVAATFAEGSSEPASPDAAPGQSLELWYDWEAPLRLVSMSSPDAGAKVLDPTAQAVGYAAVYLEGTIAIARVTGLTASP